MNNRNGLTLTVASFVSIIALGCAFIFMYWITISVWVGLVRCVGFVMIMGGVHFVGYRIWKHQLETNQKKANVEESRKTWSKAVPYGWFWLLAAMFMLLLLWMLILGCLQLPLEPYRT